MSAEIDSGGFPPISTREADIKLALDVLGSTVEARSATYVSTPLTSGHRFAEWQSANRASTPDHPDHAEAYRRDVIALNRAAVGPIVAQLRSRIDSIVIDPTALPDIPGWTQNDYRVFWGRVIERYAERVVLMEGWEFSSGCVYEYLMACKHGMRVTLWDDRPVLVRDAQNAIRRAIDVLRALGSSVGFLNAVLLELSKCEPPEGAR